MMKIISKTKWRVLSLFTALAMLAALFPTQLPAFATTNTDSAFTVTTEDGSCSYDGENSLLTISAGGTYTISQTDGVESSTTDTIQITATADVTINLAA